MSQAIELGRLSSYGDLVSKFFGWEFLGLGFVGFGVNDVQGICMVLS